MMKILTITSCFYTLSLTLAAVSIPALSQDQGIPFAECARDQTSVQYSMSPLSKRPPPGALPFPSETATLVTPDAVNHNVRFDLCLNMDGTIELKQFVTRFSASPGGTFQSKVIHQQDAIDLSSLENFIFGENVKDLSLKLPGIEANQYFELRGWEYQGQGMVTWSEYQESGDHLILQPEVVAGLLTPGDFLQNKELCQSHERLKKGHYKIQDLEVGLSYCAFRGGGRTQGMRLVELTLRGSSLSGVIDLKESDLASHNVSFVYYHHNSCDALSIDLPELKLGMRSIATVTRDDENCLRPFFLAAGREPMQTGDSGLIYELEFPGSPKRVGNLPQCRHVLDCESDI